ncbi:MAG TPA: hypothetical protein VN436_01070, partial [Holophaga sp.]|nr:hypothetical protein [Holophaga sp.]
MDPRMRTLLRKLPALLIGLVLACIPLWAQLDSKLQSGNTDFLDLYQQSTSTKVKPEILTIFDFSGSMARLMYHPLYVNSDTTDSGTYNYMSFTLTTQSSTYTITATSTANAKNYETCVVTVGGSGTYKLYTGGKPNPLTGVTASVSTFTAGATVTFTAAGTSAVTWTANGGSPTSGSGQTFSWTVPSSSSYVTATLKGNTVGALSSTILVKPDGTQVTSTDAASCSGSSSYYGESAGASDVRNWVRAASHVRFAYAVSTSVTRTIDVPIPWKIMSSASSGNPLSSLTVVDQEVVTKNGTSTTYGTGDAIEMDTVYAQNYGAYMFSSSTSDSSGTSSTTTSTLLRRVGYNADYVDWLFTGKYTVGTYKGYYIVFDAAKLGLAGGQDTLAEGKGYGADAANYSLYVPQYSLSGTYTSETYLAASINVVPALTRGQAVKRAAIKTWIAHQADVIWAFRFLDTSTTMENGTPSSVKTISNDTENYYYSSSVYGGDSGWRLFNASSESYMQLLASKLEYNGTPLTYAMARGLAQFTDPDSIFNSVETGDDAPSQCMNHFLILFTDGLDNNNTNTTNANGSTPYLTTTSGTTSFSAKAGNTTILASPSTINQTGTYWNLFTFAGVAAHMSNSSLGTAGTNYLAATSSSSGYASSSSTTTAYPSAFLPYAIKSRGSGTSKVTFSKDHRITTMTMGISLGGYYTDSSSPKRNLFLGAVVGDPTLTSWSDISTLVPFQWDATLNSGNGGRVSGSIYFFDGNTPDTLSTSLGYAIQSAISASNINTATVANLPYLGASLGSQIYIAKFQPPTNGGSIWGGDLLMFNTRLSSNTLQIVDTAGDATTTLTSSTAYWSALSALKTNRLWSARTLYTRIPGTSSTPEPGLSTFSDTGTAYTDSSTGLQNYVAQGTNKSTYTAGSTAQKNVIRFIMGGDLDGTLDSDGRPTTNRSNIMGDVINSSPAAIEYNYADVASSLPATLKAVGGDRFRLILVGTNQGWMHAFGEVTKASTITDSSGTSRTLRVGAVDELWAFMPTDFLSNLDQVTVSTNAHRFLVDGAPNIYHLDLPSSSGVSGDGKVEITTSPGPERVIALFGLGKGGRSYYALDVSNPFSPSVKWSIVPDEAAYFPASRILTRTGAPTISTVRTLLAHMGFSTCTPAIGRVLVTTTPGDSTTSI